jgi:hypothetical protein
MFIFTLLIGVSYTQEDSIIFYSKYFNDSISVCNGNAKKAFDYYKKYIQTHKIKNDVEFYNTYMNYTSFNKSDFKNNSFSIALRCNCDNKSYPNCLFGTISFYRKKIVSMEYGPFW